MPKYSWTDSEESIMQANAAFIRGELKETPYHGGPIEHKISPNLELLNRLHRIVTTDGQEGQDEIGKDGMIYQQRPYLTFLIERKRVDYLVLWFTLRGYVISVTSERDGATRYSTIDTTQDSHHVIEKNLKVVTARDVMYPLSRSVDSNFGIYEYTHDAGIPDQPFDDFVDDWATVTIVCPIWGNPIKIEDMLMMWIRSTEH